MPSFSALAQLGEVEVVNTVKLPLGKMFGLARAFWNRRKYAVTGSLSKTNGHWSLLGKMVDQASNAPLTQWEASQVDVEELRNLQGATGESREGEIPAGSGKFLFVSAADMEKPGEPPVLELGQVLAYKLLFDLLPKDLPQAEARSWKTLCYFTESLRAMLQYNVDPTDSKAIAFAVDCLTRIVNELDPAHRLARFNLGMLYLRQGEARLAREAFTALIDRMEAEPKASMFRFEETIDKASHSSESSAYATPGKKLQRTAGRLLSRQARRFSPKSFPRCSEDTSGSGRGCPRSKARYGNGKAPFPDHNRSSRSTLQD